MLLRPTERNDAPVGGATGDMPHYRITATRTRTVTEEATAEIEAENEHIAKTMALSEIEDGNWTFNASEEDSAEPEILSCSEFTPAPEA